MKFINNTRLAFLVLFFSVIIFCFSLYQYSLGKVSNNDKLISIEIKPGSIDSIAKTLYKNNLIKNKLTFKIYVYTTGNTNLKAATYSFSENMGTKEIVKTMQNKVGNNQAKLSITFKEGLNMRSVAKIIADNTNNTELEVYELLKDRSYLTELINEYWFITDEILNNNIIYPLEGYLFPNTYYFASKDVEVKAIFKIMLDETKKQLSNYEESIKASNSSVHEILTLASIVELEGLTKEDRKNIASVFYNRLDSNMPLESDATTYYGLTLDLSERDLTKEEVYSCNAYNTRCATFKQLPISPISNPSLESIDAVINPITTNYYYFVSDKNGKIYFTKTLNQHNNKIRELKKNNLWFEYE